MKRILFAVLVACAAVLPSSASAQTITVNDLGDDAIAGNGLCTLREAVNNVLSPLSNGDTTGGDCAYPGGPIEFSVDGTISLASPILVGNTPGLANPSISIIGTGRDVTISGGDAVQILFFGTSSSASLTDLTFSNGNAGRCPTCWGGAVQSKGGLVITRCTFVGNQANMGGAVFSDISTLSIIDSTFTDNSADRGGALAVYRSAHLATVTNSTFHDNHADTGSGGALYLALGNLDVINSTFSANDALLFGGTVQQDAGNLTFRNSIMVGGVAGPAGEECHSAGGTLDADASNVSDDATCDGATVATAAAINLDPAGPQSNGGPTDTIALGVPSAAFDAGDPAVCGSVGGVDQRGFPRSGPRCDAGAFEIAGCPAAAEACKSSAPGTGSLSLKGDANFTKRTLKWKWAKGAATSPSELGDPTSTTSLWLCAYDADGTLVTSSLIPGGGTCKGKPCWTATGNGATAGFSYRNPSGPITSVKLKAGPDGAAQVQVSAKGDFDLPAFPVLQTPGPLAVQLVNLDTASCWGATYSSPALTDPADGSKFQDRND